MVIVTPAKPQVIILAAIRGDEHPFAKSILKNEELNSQGTK
jgi:hypothetical protein